VAGDGVGLGLGQGGLADGGKLVAGDPRLEIVIG
jgi:hypothetical protein